MKSDSRGHWCIYYCKVDDPKNWKTMKVERTDGVLVAAKTFDEVFKFLKVKDAFDFAKHLIEGGKYDVAVKKVSPARGDAFYLSGS